MDYYIREQVDEEPEDVNSKHNKELYGRNVFSILEKTLYAS